MVPVALFATHTVLPENLPFLLPPILLDAALSCVGSLSAPIFSGNAVAVSAEQAGVKRHAALPFLPLLSFCGWGMCTLYMVERYMVERQRDVFVAKGDAMRWSHTPDVGGKAGSASIGVTILSQASCQGVMRPDHMCYPFRHWTRGK